MAKTVASYSKSSGPNGVEFKIIPATSPQAGFSLPRLILAGILAYFALAAIAVLLKPILLLLFRFLAYVGLDNSIAFVGGSVFLVVGVFVWMKSYRWLSAWYLRTQAKTRYAYEVELLVNSSGVKNLKTDQFISRDDIHRLVVKNGFDGSVDIPMTNMVAAGNALTVGTMVASQAITNGFAAIANATKRAVAAVSYQVAVEAGGVSHVVAGGLSDVCAYGLMTDIDRALNS